MLFTNPIDSFHVCTVCGYLFQSLPESEQPQRCSCQQDNDAPRWHGYDFNERAVLCHCCSTAVLASGSRWYVWFCDNCINDVKALHDHLGGTVIPIGRHSLMNGIAVVDQDVHDSRVIEGYVNDFRHFILDTNHLSHWHKHRVIELIEKIGFVMSASVHLPDYLTCAKELAEQDYRYSQGGAFDALCVAFGVLSIHRPGPCLVVTDPEGDHQ